MTTYKKVFKVFLAWQDHSEEIWLNEMAKKGWALKSYKFFYTFEKIEPTSYIYRLDYKSTSDDDLDEYKMIFQDTDWEYVTRYGNWHYFRTLGSEEHPPEIYTEHEYQIEKYNSLLQSLITALVALITLIVSVVLFQNSLVLDVFFALLIMIFFICIFKVRQKITKLRE